MGSKIPGQSDLETRRSRTWPPSGLEWEKKSCSVVKILKALNYSCLRRSNYWQRLSPSYYMYRSQTAWLRLSLNVWQSHINHLKHVQRSYKLNETLDIELQEERKSNNEALVRCKDLHEQLQRNTNSRNKAKMRRFGGYAASILRLLLAVLTLLGNQIPYNFPFPFL
nr:filament-like plant protein 4 [Ipomoea batatas]